MKSSQKKPLALAVALLGCALSPALYSQNAPAVSVLPTAEAFRHPAPESAVHVWWHWLDGAITREGITRDLEVMKAQGVSEATILNVGLFDGRDFGVPRVIFGTPEWFAMYRWALDEAARLGLTIGVHNCDGWSSSGGPWITPEQSMKQFTWTKTLVAGGQGGVVLPAPAAVEGFYRDVAVVAYRTTQRPSRYAGADVHFQLNGKAIAAGPLSDGCPVSSVAIKAGDQLVVSSSMPLKFSRVAAHLRLPFMWADPAAVVTHVGVEVSSDGQTFRPLTELTFHGLNHTETLDVPATEARQVRFTVKALEGGTASMALGLSELDLLNPGETPLYNPAIPFIGEKTASLKSATDDVIGRVGSDAGAIAPQDVVVLTGRLGVDGRLDWQVPAGDWAVLRFGYTATGATNGPATKEGQGLECDKLDAAAVEHHFHAFPERLINEAGPHAGQTLRFIFVDSWEAGFQNWTGALPAEFEKRHGYSLLAWLPVLTGETVASARESEAVIFDLRSTIADLIRENYYERLAALLHERKIEFHAEVIYGGAAYPPLDILRATKEVDLPMFEFWTNTNENRLVEYGPVDGPFLNLPTCAAADYGKALVGAEAYTGYAHYSEAPVDLKPFGDRAFASGINRMILHSSVHQPTDWKPGMTLGEFASHFNRNNLYWNHAASWLEYQARVQSLLGRGAPVFDVLYFLGDQLPESFEANTSTSLPAGYAVNAVNADVLATRLAVRDGRLRLNGGGEAAVLSLPPTPVMSLATLQRLEALVGAGARVYGPKPQHPLSLADGRSLTEFQALADRLWGPVDGRTTFSAPYGKGLVFWGRPLAEVLRELSVPPQFAAAPAGDKEFLFVHRHLDGAEVFFVANQQDRALDRECLFRVGEKTPEIWDPETGAVTRPAVFRVDEGRLRLPVHFKAHQAYLFVFKPTSPGRHLTAIARGDTALFPAAGPVADTPQFRFGAKGLEAEAAASGNYRVTTSAGRSLAVNLTASSALTVADWRGTLELNGPGVAKKEAFAIADLRPLSDYQEPEIRYFSGEATYRMHFAVPGIEAVGSDVLRLNIGGFESIAEVTLNGRPIGQLWQPDTALDVTGLLRRENELVVKVVNVYRNRLIGDLAQFGELKNLRSSAPIRQFLSPDRPLKRSGLFGPLTVTRVPVQTVPGFGD